MFQVLDSGLGNSGKNEDVQQIACTLAMHAAAMKPSYQTRSDVPASVIEEAKEEAKAQLDAQGDVQTQDTAKLSKIMEGKMSKAVQLLYKRDVLFEQDLATSADNLTVEKFLKQESTRLGSAVTIKDWALFVIS